MMTDNNSKNADLDPYRSSDQDRDSRIRAIVDTVVDGIITIDEIGTIETFNPAAVRIFGYTLDDVVGENVRMLMPDPYQGEHDGYLHSYLTSGHAKVIGIGREVIGQRKDGSTFPMELAVNEMKVGQKRMFTGIVRDITERKQAEQEISDREERTRAIVNTVVDGIITIDNIGTIETFNPAAERIFGYTLDDVVGENVRMLMPAPYRGEHDGYLKSYLTSGEAKVIGIGREVVGQRKDGTTFPMELAVNEMKVGQKRMFTGIVRDITDRKEADRAKGEFVSTVSHELRTPLTSIKGALGLIRSGAIGEIPEKLRAMLDIAYNNSNRLVLLINDILDIEKINAGKMEFVMAPLDVISLVDEAIEANKGYGDEHSVTFTKSTTITMAQVNGDRGRLMQVLSNLMSNAAKFSPDGEKVELSIIRIDRMIRIAVTDKGPGIPDDFKKTIFQKFSQADSSDTRKKGGTGLGLNITKAIVEQHGGSIGFESESGKGSIFFFDLPELMEQAVREDSMLLEPRGDGRSRILHVEDDDSVLQVVSALIADTADVIYARSYRDASALLEREVFDLVILDLILPDGDGEALLSLLNKPGQPSTPVIIFSAKDISRETVNSVTSALVKSQTTNEVLLDTIRATLVKAD